VEAVTGADAAKDGHSSYVRPLLTEAMLRLEPRP
jgi:hypothetical protein